MANTSQVFYWLWQEENIREKLFSLLSKEDICAVRIANSACCNLLTKRLFMRTNLTFTANTFTRPCRVQALSRIGHHIEHLTFYFPHSEATFLPPLIHPLTGHEISFLYTPHTSMASVLARPKYGNSELGDILTQQYPPLFHAATNVPSFINAMKHLPNMRHLTIKTPGQDPSERYRRDIVDYALISLRIAIERTTLNKLSKLSLSSVHPAAFNYLRHVPGFGCMPSAGRRWKQIRKLYISVESWDFYGTSPGLDHLKIMDDYVRHFAPSLDKFTFTWLGRKGPCPLALAGDPLFAPPRNSKKLFNEVTSPMSPLPPTPRVRRPIVFPRLRYLQVRNATMNAPQLADLVASHRGTVREFDFENVALLGGGSWDDALAPLMDGAANSDVWSRCSTGGGWSEAESFGTATTSAAHDEAELPSPSAAVAAVSKELLDLDIEGLEAFVGVNSEYQPHAEPEGEGEEPEAIPEQPVEIMEPVEEEDDGGLASDIAAAKEASMSFSTKLKKKRVRRRRRKPWHMKDHTTEDGSGDEQHRSRADDERSEKSERHHHRDQRQRQRSGSSHRRHHHDTPRHPLSGEPMPDLSSHPYHQQSEVPEVIGTDDEADYYRPETPRPLRPLSISAPMPAEPLAVLLQPTVYNPSGSGSGAAGDGLSAVQRNIEQEEAQRLLAEDVSARVSALRKAKEAVLLKLSREFCKGKNKKSIGLAARCGAGESTIGFAHTSNAGMRSLFGARSVMNVAQTHQSLESNSALVPLMFSRS